MPRPKRVPTRTVNPGGTLNVRLPDSLYLKVQAEATRQHISMSAITRWALETYCDRDGYGSKQAAS